MKSKLKTEIIAGITSFSAISYIIIVNPIILADAGIPMNLSIFATIFSSIIGCLLMYFWADAPVILTPGMGINAFFTYTLVKSMEFSWQEAIAISIISSLIYACIAFTPIVEILVTRIPATLKVGITAGIGLFLVELGLEKTQLIVKGTNDSLIALGSLQNPATILGIFGLVLTLVLFLKKVPGNFIIAIGITTALGILFGIKGQSTDINLGNLSNYGEIFMKGNFDQIFSLKFVLAVFSMTMILVFESIGLLEGILPDKSKFKKSFQSSSISAILSGLLGTSPTVAAAESASGIESGGRTGISSLVSAIMFGLAIFFIGALKYVPQAAIAPVIIITGALMMQEIKNIDLADFSEWFPAFLIIILIPFTGSISTGMAFGFISYPLVKLASGQYRIVHPITWAIGIVFLISLISSSILV